MEKKLLLLLGVLLLLPCISAYDSFGTFKQNDTVNLYQYCDTCTYVLLTSMKYPNGSILNLNEAMTKEDTNYNYYWSDTQATGDYFYTVCGDKDGSFICEDMKFEITTNGKPLPSGVVIVLFIIAFIILIGTTCYLALYSLGHLMSLDFDIRDLAIDWGVYFIIVALYFLEEYYLGNLGIKNYLLWFLSIGGILLVFIPIVAFIMSMIIGSLNKRKMSNPQPPKMFRRFKV